MYARLAAMYIHSYCRQKWPTVEDGKDHLHGTNMASTMCQGSWIDVFDVASSGTHKYIPTHKLNEDLGLRQGAGVFGYYRFKDGSYLLMTCDGPLAYWSGNADDKAKLED